MCKLKTQSQSIDAAVCTLGGQFSKGKSKDEWKLYKMNMNKNVNKLIHCKGRMFRITFPTYSHNSPFTNEELVKNIEQVKKITC